jgi:hypothetical protein
LAPLPRPPPAELTPEQAGLAFDRRGDETAHFLGGGPFSVEYCRHVVLAGIIAKAIEASDVGKELTLLARESAMIAMLASRMRLTPRSRTDSRADHRDPTSGPDDPAAPNRGARSRVGRELR